MLQIAFGLLPGLQPHAMFVPWQVFGTEPHCQPLGRSEQVFGTQHALPTPQTSPAPVHGQATFPPHAFVAFAQLPGVQVGVGQLHVPATPTVELVHVAGAVQLQSRVLPPQLSGRS